MARGAPESPRDHRARVRPSRGSRPRPTQPQALIEATMEFRGAEATNLFIGTEDAPRQLVRLRLVGDEPLDGRGPARVRIEGATLRTEEPVAIGPLGKGQEVRIEVGIVVDDAGTAGQLVAAE